MKLTRFDIAMRETMRLKVASVTRYYTILKNIAKNTDKEFKEDFDTIKACYGGITPVLVGVLAIRYDLNYKATFFMLELICDAPSGLYDKVITDDNLKVGDVLKASRKLEGCPIEIKNRYKSKS
ncbi:MAG: hypothetical protein GY928_33995 [Colwellia sp.]|nr:hypothetical protein [Colwellia sp.]